VSEKTGFQRLVEIMDRLREPGGCPWDREQTYESLRSYLIEECYEVAEALDDGDAPGLREELGDLLLQIVFLSRLAKEDGEFTIDDVVSGIVDKMVRRHPHVFGEESADSPDEVLEHWERIKRQDEPSILAGIPRALPALLKAQRLGTKAARVGFDWPGPRQVMAKVDEEREELVAAMRRGDAEAVRAEVGDLLFAVVNLARHLDVDPEGALERTNLKFTRRFQWIERELPARGETLEGAGLERLERLWSEAKRKLET
jgi:MazG family protein